MLKRIFQGALMVFFALALLAYFALRPIPARPALGEVHLTELAGNQIQYYVSGSGPVVVLLASFARSASDFNELAQALNELGYRTIAIQAGGIEGSDWLGMSARFSDYAAQVAQVLESEALRQPVVIVGHAFGNRIARSFASNYPQRTRAIALLAAGGEEATPAEVSAAIQTILFGFNQTARRQAVADAFFAETNTPPDYWLSGWYPLAGLAQAAATAASEFSRWGAGGTAPMLVLQSLEDKAAPADVAGRALKQRFPERVSYFEVANAGHAFLPEQPQWLVEHLSQFLKPLYAVQ